MPYCTSCGVEVQVGSRFCQVCGHGLGTLVQELNYRISPNRIIIMTVLSWSLYYFYWLYITWKHYRDHTGQEAYPIWHALTQLVPIYGLFRVYAHVRSFKELMIGAGVATTISAGGAVVVVLLFGVLGGVESTLISDEITKGVALVLVIIDIVSVIIIVGLLLSLQGNLNRYWDSRAGFTVPSARIGVGEVIFALIGVLAWADTFATWLSPEYRDGTAFAGVLTRCCLGA